MKLTLILLCLLAIAVVAYVRFAPVDADRWQEIGAVDGPGQQSGGNTYLVARQITTPPEAILTALDRVITETPRTSRIAGGVADGKLIYVTRSRLFRFPDITTVTVRDTDNGPLLLVRGAARFGLSDIGVNKARIDGWLGQLGPLVVTPS